MMTPELKAQAAALLGRQITVTLECGQTEDVTVRQYRMREQEKVMEAMPQWKRLVEIACDRPAGWSDLITFESFRQLRAAVEEVNEGFFDECAANLRLEMRLLGPEVSGNLMARFAESRQSSKLPGSSSRPEL